jgi:hypothetical protein
VYKDFPTPLNRNQEFTLTLTLSGTYREGTTNHTVSATHGFTLKHGWYLKVVSTNDNATASGHTTAFVQSVVQVFDASNMQQGSDIPVRWEKTGVTGTNNSFTSLNLSIS